jgi:hypothetical protein
VAKVVIFQWFWVCQDLPRPRQKAQFGQVMAVFLAKALIRCKKKLARKIVMLWISVIAY